MVRGRFFSWVKFLVFWRLLVLVDAAVVLVEVGDVAALVADGEVDVDEVYVDFEGLDVADVDGLGFGFAGGGWSAGGGCLLRVEEGGETKGEDGGDEAERAHTPLDDEVEAEFAEKFGAVEAEWARRRGRSASKGGKLSIYEDGGRDRALVV